MNTSLKNKSAYLTQQKLLDHSRNPLNYGLIESADFVSDQHNPSCGDSVSFSGVVQDDKLVQVGFEGSGCVLSLAMASMLTEQVMGMSLDAILKLDESIVSQLLGLDLGPNRMQCGMLSVMALQSGIKKYQQSK